MNSNTIIGALFFVGGLLFALVIYAMTEGGGVYVVAWGAVLFGSILMFMGVTQRSDTDRPVGLAREQIEAAGTTVILRSMISMAAADGHLDDEEVGMIQLVTRSIFGSELGEDTIRDMSRNMISGRGDLSIELARVADVLTSEDADLAVTGMAMVAMADGSMDESESARLEDYANALNVDQQRFDGALEKAREAITQILSDDGDGAESQ